VDPSALLVSAYRLFRFLCNRNKKELHRIFSNLETVTIKLLTGEGELFTGLPEGFLQIQKIIKAALVKTALPAIGTQQFICAMELLLLNLCTIITAIF